MQFLRAFAIVIIFSGPRERQFEMENLGIVSLQGIPGAGYSQLGTRKGKRHLGIMHDTGVGGLSGHGAQHKGRWVIWAWGTVQM